MPRRDVFTDEEKAEIRERRRAGWTFERLADWYWSNTRTMWRICVEETRP